MIIELGLHQLYRLVGPIEDEVFAEELEIRRRRFQRHHAAGRSDQLGDEYRFLSEAGTYL